MEHPKSDIPALKEAMTIVVPVYNRAHLIGRCLDSLYAQTYRPIRVIVVDNASSDGTPSKVSDWISGHSAPDFSVSLHHEEKQGAAFARQKGLDLTLTDKVMFFDSDDSMRPDCVSAAMNTWAQNPNAEIIAWPAAYHYPKGTVITHSISGNLIIRHLVHAILRTLGYAVKTDTIRKVGGWKGGFRTWDDFELGVRLLLQSPEVIGLDAPMADVYPQDESITGTDYAGKAGTWEHSIDEIETYIRKSGRSDSHRLLNVLNYRRMILAADYAKENRPDLAAPLLDKVFSSTSGIKKLALGFAFYYTCAGLRGAFRIVGPLL